MMKRSRIEQIVCNTTERYCDDRGVLIDRRNVYQSLPNASTCERPTHLEHHAFQANCHLQEVKRTEQTLPTTPASIGLHSPALLHVTCSSTYEYNDYNTTLHHATNKRKLRTSNQAKSSTANFNPTISQIAKQKP